MGNTMLAVGTFAVAVAALTTASSAAIELTTNGGFEAGNTSGWTSFPSPTSTFTVTNDAASGAFAGRIFNSFLASAAVIKQANIGVGQVQPGDAVTIKFSAKGEGAVGGVVFAEFFSELSGGGTSSAQILGGAPLNLTNSYQNFVFNTVAGPDVSGGITLQFAIVTGGASGSTSLLLLDNVSVSIIPSPAAWATLGLGGLAAARRRR